MDKFRYLAQTHATTLHLGGRSQDDIHSGCMICAPTQEGGHAKQQQVSESAKVNG